MPDFFPESFLFGAATSSHQVEGDNRNNDWWEWEQVPSRLADGQPSGDAAGWWAGKAEDDLAAACALGHNAHRMSLEWSRIEPEPGRFDDGAIARYREILRFGRAQGLAMMVTLNHFTLPCWVASLGGWLALETPSLFAAYAEHAARALGEDVALWATLNEPSVLAYVSYGSSRWPPGKGSLVAALTAIGRMLEAHARGYEAVHRAVPGAKVGLVINSPHFAPSRPAHPLDRASALAQDWAFNGVVRHALITGRLALPLWPRRVAGLRKSVDWLGLNFYGRYDVRFDPTAAEHAFGRHVQEPTIRTGDNDWGQPDPAAMVAELERLSALGVPLYVTENGINDVHDRMRPKYLVDHLRALSCAIARGLDVRGYFHWSLVDNFEWAEGWSAHFGLLALDRATGERKPRKSAEVYAAICRARGVPDDLVLSV